MAIVLAFLTNKVSSYIFGNLAIVFAFLTNKAGYYIFGINGNVAIVLAFINNTVSCYTALICFGIVGNEVRVIAE